MYNGHDHECESEEDCEIYYLRPVNEYNIIDKIKEANKELFAVEAMVNEGDPDKVVVTIATNRRVQFALNLENYDESGADGAISGDDASEAMQENANPADWAIYTTVDEAENKEEEIAEILTATLKDNATEKERNQHSSKTETNLDEEEIIEEICEEMCTVLKMDTEATRSGASGQPLQLQQQRKKMFKQATFNFDDRDDADDDQVRNEDGQDDTKLPTNEDNNIVQNEHICGDIHIENNNCGVLGHDVVIRAVDDDEEDQLSVIVAAYIPDDFDYVRDKDKFVKKRKCSPPFNRRRNLFSIVPPPEVPALKFNYRTCCEYRHAVTQQEKLLPKYTGYLSEYGLTREQLAKRATKVQQKQRFVVEKALLANEQEMLKMQDNERAFTTWLKRKMRSPINKTRNMFDVLRSKSSNGSNNGGSNGGCRKDNTDPRNRCKSGKNKK